MLARKAGKARKARKGLQVMGDRTEVGNQWKYSRSYSRV